MQLTQSRTMSPEINVVPEHESRAYIFAFACITQDKTEAFQPHQMASCWRASSGMLVDYPNFTPLTRQH
jgi:hypothetical protein